MTNKFKQKLALTPRTVFLLILVSFIFYPLSASAFSMDSTNYQIEEDTINFMGEPSSSLNYQLNDTGGEVATGQSSSTHFALSAGFWGASEATISISGPSVINMGDISGTGFSNLATNSGTYNIKTDNFGGYILQWHASSTDMTSGSDSISSFIPTASGVPNIWNSMPNNTSWWGGHLGASSTTTDTGKWGTLDTYAGGKWLNLETIDYTVISRPSSTTTAGDDEVFFTGAEIGSNKIQPNGTYSVTVILTALAL